MPFTEIITMMLPGFIVSIITFITVESIAYKDDESNITGFIAGAVLAVLFGSIVDVAVLIFHVWHL